MRYIIIDLIPFPEEKCSINNEKIENILAENVSQYMEKKDT